MTKTPHPTTVGSPLYTKGHFIRLRLPRYGTSAYTRNDRTTWSTLRFANAKCTGRNDIAA